MFGKIVINNLVLIALRPMIRGNILLRCISKRLYSFVKYLTSRLVRYGWSLKDHEIQRRNIRMEPFR